jgi:glycosyltransferase involved in cell wall biosynthesis
LVTLHIDTGAEMRGGQWQALYLIPALHARGHHARLLAPKDSPLLKVALDQGLDASALRLAKLPSESTRADLIHAHDARAHTLVAALGKPLVISRRVAFPVQRNPASRWKYRRATQFIAVSEFVKATLLEAGVDPDRIAVIHDGVPIPPLANVANRSGVLALDSDDPGKGKPVIQQAAKLANVAVSFSTNLSSDLPQAELFVYVTDLEGLGSAVLLAMAHGTPVLASRVGGIPEIIDDGVTGALTSNDPRDIASAIQRLLSDSALRARIAANGRARVEQDFSIDRMVSKTLQVYERILT